LNTRAAVTTAWLLAAAAACGHDWSAADGTGDGAEADVSTDDARVDGDSFDDGADADVDVDGTLEDSGPEDVPPVECTSTVDCDDGNPCTSDTCDLASRICIFAAVVDDTPCGDGAICCGSACIDARDPAHCGACTNVCATGPHATAACPAGACTLACDTGFLDCDGARETGCEADSTTDETSCGVCGTSCGDAETCFAGSCLPSWVPVGGIGTPPSARRSPKAVWTGSEAIVWGGHAGGACFPNGGRYSPASDRWTSMATPPATVTGCHRHVQVWTGSEMIVWGGSTGATAWAGTGSGARYEPIGNSWTSMSNTGAPSARFYPAYEWTGTALFVWGGLADRGRTVGDGALYDPATDAWSPISVAGSPSARYGAAAVWTGSAVLLWGGYPAPDTAGVDSGARYDPATNTWTPISAAGAPSGRGTASVVWTGREMLVWGGATSDQPGVAPVGSLGDGAAYDPATDSWRPLAGAGAPTARFQACEAWTGARLIVWGGTNSRSDAAFNTGAAYDPVLDAWTPVTTAGAPSGRRSATAVWSGTEMVVWGGGSFNPATGLTSNLDDGGRYRPR
jgi:N-acetylneuraminic acid mutarotase